MLDNVTWKILSNYQTHGLAFTVKHEQRRIARRIGLRADVARRYALDLVRTSLVSAIDKGEFRNV
jgi:hypothetical protein